jgi:predicted nucleic acid-binding protein
VRVYLDSSVILRRLLDESGKLAEWGTIESAVSSEITRVECLRTIDRLRLAADIDPRSVMRLRQGVFRILDHVELVGVSRVVLERAATPFPTPLRTLGAIHLSTALVWQDVRGRPLVMATHDEALATAAGAMGLESVGSDPDT